MPVEVTTRHMEVRQAIQTYARSLGELLMESFPRIENVHVVLDIERHKYVAAVVVQGKRHTRFETVEKCDDNMRAALDMAFDSAERYMRKQVDRGREQKRARGRLSEP